MDFDTAKERARLPREMGQPSARDRLGRLGLAGAVALQLAAGAACSNREPTEVVGGVSTQIRLPDHIKTVGVVVQENGSVEFCETYAVRFGEAILPSTLGVLGSATGLDDRQRVRLSVLGMRVENSPFITDCGVGAAIPEPNAPNQPGDPVSRETMVLRRRVVTLVDQEILYLNMPLKESCRDVACSDDETCVGGVCVPIDIRDSCPVEGEPCGEDLPPYDDSLVYGTTNTCFDPSQCFPAGATVPALLEDPETCTFRVPWPEEFPRPAQGDMNVRVLYDSFGTEFLDRDAEILPIEQRDGFSLPNPNDPFLFQLAPNLCESNYKTERILRVEGGMFCPGKRAFQPICEDYVAPDPRDPNRFPDPRDPNGEPGLCTIANLEPVESALYVLMDQSNTMFSYYGADAGFDEVVSIPLSSPTARRSQAAFSHIPAAAAQCGTDAYSAPLVPFARVAQVSDPIGNILRDSASVLADNPPEMNLQAALQGAYTALRQVAPADPTGAVERRAVIVISNRDILQGPCDGPTAQDLARQATQGAAPIATYAVALGDGDPLLMDDAADALTVASASALAQAGGTQVYNGVADAAEGASALTEVLTELNTCVYRVRRLDLGTGALPPRATLSYVDPTSLTQQVVDIERNQACTENSGPEVSGWNLDAGGRVLICGAACDALREVTTNVGLAQLARQRVSPPVPVVANLPCDDLAFQWLPP